MTLTASDRSIADYKPVPVDNLGTVGCPLCNAECFYIPQGSRHMMDALRQEMSSIMSPAIRNQVGSLCSQISAGLIRFDIQDTLPDFHIEKDDDEFYMEWIFDFYRFGFDFYEDESRSGWFVTIRQNGAPYRNHSKFNNDYRSVVEFALRIISAAGYES